MANGIDKAVNANTSPVAAVQANEMRRRGHPEQAINQVFYENPKRFLSQCPKFQAA